MIGELVRLRDALGEELRALLGGAARTGPASRTMAACLLALLAALLLQLQEPWWAVITAFVIAQRDARATLGRSLDRVLGTVLGAAAGYVMAAFADDHLTFALLTATMVAAALYGQERVRHGYAMLLAGITVVLVLFGSLVTPAASLAIAVYRALEIGLGVTVASVIEAIWSEPGRAAAVTAPPGFLGRPVDAELLATALTGGIAVALIPFVWEGLQLPGLGQTPITAFVIMTATRSGPLAKALSRMVGCLLGGALGLLVMALVGDAFLPWIAGTGLGLLACAHLRHGSGDVAYAGQQAGIAFIMATVQGGAPSADILPAIDRLVGVAGGMAVAGAALAFLAPGLRAALARLGLRAPASCAG